VAYYIAKTVSGTFDSVVADVTARLKSLGFGILSDIDVQATLKTKIGADMPKYRILGDCNPRFAREALKLSPRDPFAAIYCGVAAYCQYVGKNYAEAIRLSREALRQRTDFVGAHRVLTASLGMAGSTDAAKTALEGLRRAQPNITLAWLASELPFEHDADKAHYVEGFRRAGLR